VRNGKNESKTKTQKKKTVQKGQKMSLDPLDNPFLPSPW